MFPAWGRRAKKSPWAPQAHSATLLCPRVRSLGKLDNRVDHRNLLQVSDSKSTSSFSFLGHLLFPEVRQRHSLR